MQNAVTVNAGDVLFYINYNGSAADAATVQMTDKQLVSEIYDANMNTTPLTMVRESIGEEVILYQNTPNPFETTTAISVWSPAQTDATLIVHDISGRVIASYDQQLNAGMNQFTLNRGELKTAGVLFYTLKTDNYSATKRMVVIR